MLSLASDVTSHDVGSVAAAPFSPPR
jgi:hypothetical protein